MQGRLSCADAQMASDVGMNFGEHMIKQRERRNKRNPQTINVKTEKKLTGENDAMRVVSTLFQKKTPRSSPLKKEAFSQEMHFKILLLKRGFEIVKFGTRL
jgi:hypothetical protein